MLFAPRRAGGVATARHIAGSYSVQYDNGSISGRRSYGRDLVLRWLFRLRVAVHRGDLSPRWTRRNAIAWRRARPAEWPHGVARLDAHAWHECESRFAVQPQHVERVPHMVRRRRIFADAILAAGGARCHAHR